MKHRNIPYRYLEWTTFKGEKASGYLCKYFNLSPWYIDVLPAQTEAEMHKKINECLDCLLYTSPSPRDRQKSRMPSSA